MIERVMAAISEQQTRNAQIQSFAYDGVYVIRDLLEPYGEQELFRGGDSGECDKEYFQIKAERVAHAAIEAMREPTHLMLIAAISHQGRIPYDKSEETTYLEDAKLDYQSMIDAAMSVKGTPDHD